MSDLCSLEAEAAVIGSALVNPQAYPHFVDYLDADDFFINRHGLIFSAIGDLYGKGDPIDVLTVSNHLRALEHLDTIGGAAYLTELVNSTPMTVNYTAYGMLVSTLARRRRLASVLDDAKRLTHDERIAWDDVARDVVHRIVSVADDGLNSSLSHISELASAHFDRVEKLQHDSGHTFGLPSGFNKLDKIISGLTKTDLIIVAARPGMGKSSFLSTMALNVARHNLRVLFFSLEMKRPQVYDRLVQIETAINFQELQRRSLTGGELQRYTEASARIAQLPIWIDDKARLTPSQIRAKVERVNYEHGVDVIMVDYMQLMRSDIQFASKYEEISEVSQSLKELAMEFNVPVVAAAQLNRETEKTNDKRPHLDNLRGSGQIEQDADIVMFLYSQDYYADDPPPDFDVEVIVEKHRDGPTGIVDMKFQRSITRFSDDLRNAALRVL